MSLKITSYNNYGTIYVGARLDYIAVSRLVERMQAASSSKVSFVDYHNVSSLNGLNHTQTSQLSLFHSETQGFWSILKVILSNLTVKTVSLTQNVEPNHPKLG